MALPPVPVGPSGGPPALGISGISWSLMFLGGFWLLSLFHIPLPDRLAPVIVVLFFWSLIYVCIYFCRRYPVAGSLIGSFIMGMCGWRRWGRW
jgi:hypothetical protein